MQLTTRSALPASAMAHNWVLVTLHTDAEAFAKAGLKAKDNDYIPPEMEDQVIAQTRLETNGETAEVTFTVPAESGEYDFLCTYPGHFTAGMRGTFIVKGMSENE